MVGLTYSTSGIATAGVHQKSIAGLDMPDGFIVKFNTNGHRAWATYYGGELIDGLNAISVNLDGSCYVGGWTKSKNGISTPGSHLEIYSGLLPGVLAKFTSTGILSWGTYYPAAVNGLDVHASGVYITGVTVSETGIATHGAHQPHINGVEDAFIAKFDLEGKYYWGTYYGGKNHDNSTAVVVNSGGEIYITGITFSESSIATPRTQQEKLRGIDAFFGEV